MSATTIKEIIRVGGPILVTLAVTIIEVVVEHEKKKKG